VFHTFTKSAKNSERSLNVILMMKNYSQVLKPVLLVLAIA
jgi:hypothetical protein